MSPRRTPTGEHFLKCSFCNKPQVEVKKLIAGPGVYICDECIGVCNGILAGEGDAPEPSLEAPKRWFVAVLVVEVLVEGSTDGPFVDLQHRLIEAPDADSAYEAALDLGRRVPDLNPGDADSGVRWRFAGLHDLAEVDASALAPETEVYSRFAHDPPKTLVVPKKRLTVFWLEAHRRK